MDPEVPDASVSTGECRLRLERLATTSRSEHLIATACAIDVPTVIRATSSQSRAGAVS
jgi:hypothetical protein